MHDVFISYSHHDAEIRAEIVEKLESAGIRCWYAPRNIQAGEEWADAITRGLKDSRALILIFTEASNDSSQVLREVGLAVDLKKPIFPCRCDETIPSGSMQYYLSTLHWLDFTDEDDEFPDELPELIRTKLSEEKPAEVPEPVSGGRERKKRGVLKPVLWIAAAILALNIGLVFLLFSKGLIGKKELPSEAQPDDTLEQLIDDGVTTATGEDIRSLDLDQLQSVVVNNKLYYFSTDHDSPGADNFLYTLEEDDTIRLDDYKGTEQREILIPEVIDGLPVTEIGEACFQNDRTLEKVTMPDTVDVIGVSAFAGCSELKEAVFSANLKKIDIKAFENSGLINVVLPVSVESIEAGAFSGCENLETIFLPKGIEMIPQDVLRGTPNLKTVTIAAEKVLIDKDAFDSGVDLTLIGVPGSYTETYAEHKGFTFQEYKAKE